MQAASPGNKQFRILLIAKAIAIINRNHVLIRLPPPLRRMRFSEATLKALDPERPIREADIERTEIPQCSGLLPYRWLCYLLGKAQRWADSAPVSIQNDSGLAQGLAGRSAAG